MKTNTSPSLFNSIRHADSWLSLLHGLSAAALLGLVSGAEAQCGCTGFGAIPTNGLVAWWRGERNAQDSIGANHGSLSNGVSFGPGRCGTAFKLDGEDDYLAIPDSAALKPSELTVSFWFKLAVPLGSNSFAPLVAKMATNAAYNGSCHGYDFVYSTDTQGKGGISFGLPLKQDFRVGVGVRTNFSAGAWYHVVGTYSTAGQKLYVNGVLAETGFYFSDIAYSTNGSAPILVGRLTWKSFPDPTTRYFNGEIDELAIWNRALSAEEVACAYRLGSIQMTIRCAAVEVCWTTQVERLYQVQYRSAFTTNQWVDFGTPVSGNGTPMCVTDAVGGEEKRFYRVIELP